MVGIDTEETAWAAGFFEAEGCYSYTRAGRYAVLSIGQTDRSPLDRFARAVRAGRVSGPVSMQSPHRPSKKPQYRYYLYRAEELWRVAKLLLPYLGAVKRAQIIRVHSLVAARSRPPGDINTVSSTTATPAPGRTQLAWAAGFFDGEGCFSLSRSTSYPCVSITQREPQVLLRFADAWDSGSFMAPIDIERPLFLTRSTSSFERMAIRRFRRWRPCSGSVSARPSGHKLPRCWRPGREHAVGGTPSCRGTMDAVADGSLLANAKNQNALSGRPSQ